MITLEKLTKRYGPKILFENVTMRFDPGKRYVLVGANGAGKSTLLKVISGEEESDQGSVEIPRQLRVGVLKQDHFAYESCQHPRHGPDGEPGPLGRDAGAASGCTRSR